MIHKTVFGFGYLELLLMIYGLLVNLFSRFLFSPLREVIWYMQWVKTGIYVVVMVILLLLSKKYFGKQDYRYQQMYHIVPLVIIAVNVSLYVGTVSTSYEFEYGVIGFDKLSILLLIAITPLVLLIIVTMKEIFSIADPYVEEFNDVRKKYANGNLSARVKSNNILDDYIFGRIGYFTNEMLSTSEENMRKIGRNAELMHMTADKISSVSNEISITVEQVANTSQTMSDGATTQTEIISRLNSDLAELQIIVEGITNKIQMNTQEVSQIALQTNILALNAGIEASRAGDYGRGFAVVAENVRKLSDQSQIASERIAAVAEEIRETLQVSFNDMSSTMLNVVSVSEQTAASAEEVAASTVEMATSMEEFTNLAEELSKMS